MPCSQCGKELNSSDKYCPQCGNKATVDTTTDLPSENSQETEPLQSTMQKKPMPMWFKIITFLTVLALISVTAGILFTESLVDVVDYQLEALREGDVSKAYLDYTSKDFQSSTSQEQFQHFIVQHPVFHNNQSAHFFKRSLEDHVVTLKGTLTSNDHEDVPIEYRIIQEDKKWKILSIRLLKTHSKKYEKDFAEKEDLILTIQSQLKDIENHSIEKAYQDFSSSEFKAATSFEAFQKFIGQYFILEKHHTVSFHKPNIRRGIGTVAAIIQSDQKAAYVKYYLVYEDNGWKIWNIRILSTPDAKTGLSIGSSKSKPDSGIQ